MTTTRQLGSRYEAQAQRYLERQGLFVVAKNYTGANGEIDLIMRERATLVFVEVRYRKSAGYGGAIASVNTAKQNKLIRAAQHYMVRYPHTGAVRFDLIAFEGKHAKPNWIRDAFMTYDEAIF